MGSRFSLRFPVRSYELDFLGHVNNAVYLQYLEQARLTLLEELGYPLRALIDREWRNAVVHISIDYRREALYGDVVVVHSEVETIGRTSITLRHRLIREGDEESPLAEARVVLVWQDLDGRPTPVPDEIRRALEAS